MPDLHSLHDLRATLDHRAGDVHDEVSPARVAAVEGRARAVRRRRAAGVAAAAVLAVAGVAVVSALPGPDRPEPASAPDTMTALGWTYRVDHTTATEGDRIDADVLPSDVPQLVSWATTGDDQDVRIRMNGEESRSDASDFGDFVWLPPGWSGQVSVIGAEPGLTVTQYALDRSVSPEGVGEGVTTFREDVAGRTLAGAAFGEAGQAEMEVPVTAEPGELALAHTCEGLPLGYQVRVGLVGRPGYLSSGSGCAEDTFDPGGSPVLGFAGRWRPGTALRIWVVRHGEPVADGEIDELRLGLAAYALADDPRTVAGHDFARVIEHAGKVWRLERTVTGPGTDLPRLTVPAAGDHVVTDWVVARTRTTYAVSIDGVSEEQTWISGPAASGGGPVEADPGQQVGLDVQGDEAAVEEAVLALYRRVG